MNPSSFEEMHQAEQDGMDHKNQKPMWLEAFLCKNFSPTCSTHKNIRRNWLNRYCMKCNESLCHSCLPLGHHKTHEVLKIYSHLNSDVVRLSAMEKHMDCSLIQPYKSNNKLAIALKPLPHCGQPIHNDNRKCYICKRILNEPNRYCSISCKVEAFMKKADMSDPPFLGLRTAASENPAMRMQRRKGIPHRAPLF